VDQETNTHSAWNFNNCISLKEFGQSLKKKYFDVSLLFHIDENPSNALKKYVRKNRTRCYQSQIIIMKYLLREGEKRMNDEYIKCRDGYLE